MQKNAKKCKINAHKKNIKLFKTNNSDIKIFSFYLQIMNK